MSAAPSAKGSTAASSFQIQRTRSASGPCSGSSSPLRRRPGQLSIATAVSPTIPDPAISMSSAVTGARADAASTGVDRDNGPRLAIAINAIATLSPSAATDARAHLLDLCVWSMA